jgi:hypothetical protein
MAKLALSTELLRGLLFSGADGDVEIIGAGFDTAAGCIILELLGSAVPDCEQVICIVTKERLKIHFEGVATHA